MWKWVLALVVAVAGIGGVAAFAFVGGDSASFKFEQTGKPGNNKKRSGKVVRVGTAEVGDLVRTVSAPGSIEPRELVRISSQVSAIIDALPFREGEEVQVDDVVVRLDPQNLVAAKQSAEARLLSAKARLQGAKADLANAEIEYNRLRQLAETGDVAQSEYDSANLRYLRAQADIDALEADVKVAEAGIDQAETDLENTIIESPIAGTVTALNSEVGETAIVGTTNTPGSVIMEIADLSTMLLTAQVDETNIAPVEVGQRASVFINAYPDREYRGTIEKIGLKRQVSSQGTGFFEVEILIEVPEGDLLRSGLTASTDIEVEPFFDVIRVESQAVVDRRVEDLPPELRANPIIDKDNTFTQMVYKIVDGKTIAQPVKVGPSDLTHTVILEGVEPDDQVVTGPFRILETLTGDVAVRDEAEVIAEAEERALARAKRSEDDESDPEADAEEAEPQPEAEESVAQSDTN